MEPESMLSAISSLVEMIAEAATLVMKHRDKCREVADHASMIAKIILPLDVPDVKVVSAETRVVVDALKNDLHEALKLVESCSMSGFLSGLLGGGTNVDRFDDMGKKLDRCLLLLIGKINVESAVKLNQVQALLDDLKLGDNNKLDKKMEETISMCLEVLQQKLNNVPRTTHEVAAGCSQGEGKGEDEGFYRNNDKKPEGQNRTSEHGADNIEGAKVLKPQNNGKKPKETHRGHHSTKEKVKYDNRNDKRHMVKGTNDIGGASGRASGIHQFHLLHRNTPTPSWAGTTATRMHREEETSTQVQPLGNDNDSHRRSNK